jgi:hypothetical protein
LKPQQPKLLSRLALAREWASVREYSSEEERRTVEEGTNTLPATPTSDGLSQAVDQFLGSSRPETYQRIVYHDGLSVDAYQNWLRRMLNETVLKR